LLPAVGATGIGFITTVVVPGAPVHPDTVAVTEYVPAANSVVLAIDGFCKADVKLFGPVHAYVAPAITLAVRFKGDPTQTGLLLPAVGEAGGTATVTIHVEVSAQEVPAFVINIAVYDPGPGYVYVGNCNVDTSVNVDRSPKFHVQFVADASLLFGNVSVLPLHTDKVPDAVIKACAGGGQLIILN
jgi:hypothetical protein